MRPARNPLSPTETGELVGAYLGSEWPAPADVAGWLAQAEEGGWELWPVSGRRGELAW